MYIGERETEKEKERVLETKVLWKERKRNSRFFFFWGRDGYQGTGSRDG